jgi:plastocyanin
MKKILFATSFVVAMAAGVVTVNHFVTPKAQASTAITHVSLLENAIEPSVVFVKVGQQVEFDAKDGRYHNIGQGEGNENGHIHDHTVGGVESGIFTKDEAYRASFNEAGTFNFHDHLHPDLVLTVIAYK